MRITCHSGRVTDATDRCTPNPTRPHYFNLSATLAMPAFAHASSLSPPGAPTTPTPPITWSPALIGTPPAAGRAPSAVTNGLLTAQALAVSAEVLLYATAVMALRRAISVASELGPSSRRTAFKS